MRSCAWCGEDISAYNSQAYLCKECSYTNKVFVIPRYAWLCKLAARPRRYCLECGIDITKTHQNRQRCDTCQEENLRELWLLTRELVVLKTCIDCGKLMCHIPGVALGNKPRCSSCQKKHRKKSQWEAHLKRLEKKRALTTPIQRACVDCGDIMLPIEKNHAKWRCDTCHKEYKKEYWNWRSKNHLSISFCSDCGKDISDFPTRVYRCPSCQGEYKRRYMRWYKKEKKKTERRLKCLENIRSING